MSDREHASMMLGMAHKDFQAIEGMKDLPMKSSVFTLNKL